MKRTRSPRILICRLSHIGDCILTMPVLNALRTHFPDAFLAWLVERPADQLLRDHPALDHLIVMPHGWLKSPVRVARLRSELRSLRFDVTIDPQSLTKSAIPAWLSGAPRRLGFARGTGRELALLLNNHLHCPEKEHVVDRSLELLRGLGIRVPDVEFRIPEDESARTAAEGFIRDAHLGCGYAVVNPGAGWPSRLWPTRQYAKVAWHLGQNLSLPTVVTWAGEKEKKWAEEIVSRAGGHALMAAPTSLLELAALLRRARLFVGSDTGPLHIAAAVGTTCIGLHGTTRPTQSGAYGSGHVAIQKYYQDGGSRERRRAGNEAMRAIDVEMVCNTCDRVLARRANKLQPQAA